VRAMQRSPHTLRTRRSQSGFSLVELIVAITIAGVLVGIAVPNMRSFNQNNRLTDASNDLLRSLQVARSEAITRQRTVVLCASSNPTSDTPTCNYDAFTGWIVFEDNNNNWERDDGDLVIDQHNTLSDTLTIRTDNDAIVSFNSAGFANLAGAKAPSANVVICDKRGIGALGDGTSAAMGGRALLISPTGRGRVTKLAAEVGQAAANIGGGCP
jgi:type IV fimbrial biogenesis protein FimT